MYKSDDALLTVATVAMFPVFGALFGYFSPEKNDPHKDLIEIIGIGGIDIEDETDRAFKGFLFGTTVLYGIVWFNSLP